MTRAFLTSEAAARFSQARIDAIATLGALAKQHDASFIVVAGDVFESNQLSRETLARTMDALKRLPVPVFLLPGNHDPLDASSIFLTSEFDNAPAHVIVLKDMQPVSVPGLQGVEVVGAPWRTKRPSSDLCADLAASLTPAHGVVRIAVVHGQVDTMSPDLSRLDIINLANAGRAVQENKFHYLALGDRHSVTEVGSTGRIWYSGAPVATAFDELEPNKALLVDIDDSGACSVAPLTVGQWTFIEKEWPMNGPADLEQFGTWLDALPDKVCTVVKVAFKGSVNLKTAAELDALMQDSAELFASLRPWKRKNELATVPDELDKDSVSLAGYAKDTWHELLGQAEQGDAVAEDALMLLYRLSQRSSA